MKQEYVIGIDVGGTRIKAAAVARDGTISTQAVMPMNTRRPAKELVPELAKYVKSVERKLKHSARAVGLGPSGAAEPKRGPVLLPGKFKGLGNYPIARELSHATGAPVIAENDARRR